MGIDDILPKDQDRRTRLLQSKEESMLLAESFAAGLRIVLKDKELTKGFWREGFEELAHHSANASSQWVGKRILTIVVTSVLGFCVVWLVKSGAIK